MASLSTGGSEETRSGAADTIAAVDSVTSSQPKTTFTTTTASTEDSTPAARPNDLVLAVDKLLNDLGPKFSKVSTELFSKMDEMAQRLDEMEAAIKAGHETSTPGSSVSGPGSRSSVGAGKDG